MGVELQKPFTIKEIKDSPYAVFIAFLIGFVLILSGVIAALWYHNVKADEDCNERVESKTQQIITILSERDQYKRENKELRQTQDSTVKEKTAQYVEKIIPEYK